MLESTQVGFAVSDLVHKWENVRLLLNAADPDAVYEAVSWWLRQRAVTALVAAVTVLRPDEVAAGHSWPSGPGHIVVAELRARRQELTRNIWSHPAYPVGHRRRRRNGGNTTRIGVAGWPLE